VAETARPTHPPDPAEAWRFTAERARDTTFFFDFDGVLSPVTDDPDASQPVSSVLHVLEELATVVARVAMSPKLLRDLIDQLSEKWDEYAASVTSSLTEGAPSAPEED